MAPSNFVRIVRPKRPRHAAKVVPAVVGCQPENHSGVEGRDAVKCDILKDEELALVMSGDT